MVNQDFPARRTLDEHIGRDAFDGFGRALAVYRDGLDDAVDGKHRASMSADRADCDVHPSTGQD